MADPKPATPAPPLPVPEVLNPTTAFPPELLDTPVTPSEPFDVPLIAADVLVTWIPSLTRTIGEFPMLLVPVNTGIVPGVPLPVTVCARPMGTNHEQTISVQSAVRFMMGLLYCS